MTRKSGSHMSQPKMSQFRNIHHAMVLFLGVSFLFLSTSLFAQIGGDSDSGSSAGVGNPVLPKRVNPLEEFYFIPGSPEVDPSLQDGIRIVSVEPIKTLNSVGVADGRSRVEYDDFALEADQMQIDYLAGTLTVVGNVVFLGPERVIKASRARFDLTRGEGIAYDVDGQAGGFFFKAIWDEEKNGPSFRQIDSDASVFHGTSFTSSNFPVPMFYIAAREVILISGKRIYFRDPVVYIRGVPVFWLPFVSRSLDSESPWSFKFGYTNDIGGYFRLGYRYIHRVQEPDWNDPTIYNTTSHGQLDSFVDYMTSRGFGAGAKYSYQFDQHRHMGYLQVYGIRDKDRNLDGTSTTGVADKDGNPTGKVSSDSEDGDRWTYYHKHNSLLTRNLMLQWEIDEASDPDVYVDITDRFEETTETQRGRMFEKSAQGAISWHNGWMVARVVAQRMERLARDRYTDAADPFDDDLDFDPDPLFEDGDDFDGEGIPDERFGLARERVSARVASRLVKMGASPFYTRFEANTFSAHDSGFNRLSEEDDANVSGFDLYGSVTNRLKLGQRTTWMNTLGIGVASYERDIEELIPQELFDASIPEPGFEEDGITPLSEEIRVDGLHFRDRSTIFVGESVVPRSLEGRDTEYFFVDWRSRLNHRFSNWADGYIEHYIREGNDNTLVDFYEQTGYLSEARNDIYDFYHNRHWVTGRMNFYLRYPNVVLTLEAGRNLQSDDIIYANEQVEFANAALSYANDTREFTMTTGVGYETRQIRDPQDPFQYRPASYGPFITMSYFPLHARYWASLSTRASFRSEEDPVDRDARQRRRFDEDRTEVVVTPLIGRQFGPKYRLQLAGTYTTRYSWWDNLGVTLLRDLHDAELGLYVGVNANSFELVRDDEILSEDEDLESEYELEIKASVNFKVSRENPGLGARSITTLSDLEREGQYVR